MRLDPAASILGVLFIVACASDDGMEGAAGAGGAGGNAGAAGASAQAGAGTGAGTGGGSAGVGSAGTRPPDSEIRCGDFLSASEAAGIGIADWNEAGTSEQVMDGVQCSDDVSIFPGDQIDSLLAVSASSLEYEVVDGPMLGSRAHWFTLYSLSNVLLRSTDTRWLAWIVAADQATLEPKATALLPHLDAP